MRKPLPKLALAVLMAIAAITSVPANADTMDDIRSRGAIVVGAKADYPPFGYIEKDKNVGLEIELIRAMAQDLFGKPDAFTIVPVAAVNRFQYLNTGKVDFLMAIVLITDQRKEIVDFSEPYMRTGWGVLVRKDDRTVRNIADLNGKPVVVMTGSLAEAGVTRMAPGANLLRLTDTSSALLSLQQGRAVAFAQDRSLLVGISQKEHWIYKLAGSSYDDADVGAVCRKGDKRMCDFLSSEIKKFKSNGTLSHAFTKWLGPNATQFLPK